MRTRHGKGEPAVQTGSRTATFIIGFMVLCGFAILTYAARTTHSLNYYQFFSLLTMALVACGPGA